MVKYCMNLSDEKKETAIKIALESKGNVRKRKIAVPLLMILGIVIIFSSIFLIINSPAILWYIYMVLGIVCLLLAFNAKSFQKFVLKKAELLLDKSFRTGIVEYHFDAEGIETISQMGYSKNYWTAFKEYGTMGQYIYVKRKDNKMVLIHRLRAAVANAANTSGSFLSERSNTSSADLQGRGIAGAAPGRLPAP